MTKFVRHWCLLILLPLLAMPVQAENYREGVHYQTLSKPVRTENPDQVEVVELFGYWCPHCNNLERHLKPWKQKLDPQAYFKHVPVVFRPNQEEFAKAYFVAKSLGLEEKVHGALFSLIHRQRQWINNRDELAAFFANYGVSETDFAKVYDSFSLNTQLSRARKKAREYQISGVPSMVVNGKYLVTADSAGSQREMLKVVDFLIDKEK